MVEHCVSSAKGHGFNSQGTHILIKKRYSLNTLRFYPKRKSLWIKASAKCIDVNPFNIEEEAELHLSYEMEYMILFYI